MAPFGARDMTIHLPELAAHVSEGLLKVPAEKRAQLAADIAARLKDNLKENPVEFGELYSGSSIILKHSVQRKRHNPPLNLSLNLLLRRK